MRKSVFLTAAVAMLAVSGLHAEPLKVGDAAPSFEAKDDQGQTWKSSDHVGKKVVVFYFFPAALTGGWTKQACGFRDNLKPLTEKGIEVVGISGDAVSNQALFKKTHNLGFTLLSDENGDVAKKFGVPVSKGGTFPFKDSEGNPVELKRGVTIQRTTFVIGKDGKILYQAKGDIANDPKLVLEAIEKGSK